MNVRHTSIYSTCSHWHQPLVVGTWSIYVSSRSGYFDAMKADKPLITDLMIGLCDSWLDLAVVATAGVVEPNPFTPMPLIVVDWLDGQACPAGVMPWLVALIKRRLSQGQVIDVGCLGGHGRTGTLLACLVGQVEGLSPLESIKTVRSRFCQKAVESKAQVEQVYEFLGHDKAEAEKDFSFPKPKTWNYKDWKGQQQDDDWLNQYLDKLGYTDFY